MTIAYKIIDKELNIKNELDKLAVSKETINYKILTNEPLNEYLKIAVIEDCDILIIVC